MATKTSERDIFHSFVWNLIFVDTKYCVGAFDRPPTPWASRPNSFAADYDHVSLYFGSHMSCQYFRYSPDALS